MKRRLLLGLVLVPLLLVGESQRIRYNGSPVDAAGATTITSGLDGWDFDGKQLQIAATVAPECICTCGGRCEPGGCWCIGRCWCIDEEECDACKEGCCPEACEVEGCPIQLVLAHRCFESRQLGRLSA